MNWNIAEAKSQFSKVVRAATDEPQLIFKRDRLVAALVEPETFQEYLDWRRHRESRTLADAILEVSEICREEDYTFELPPRKTRPNSFADALDDVPV